jgi:hypothetical protein
MRAEASGIHGAMAGQAVALAGVGGFHVAADGMGGQLYVQYARLAEPTKPYPLVAWPGGGLTGASYEDTPDGRPGWRWRWLTRGFDVLVCDGVGAGRAGWLPRSEPPITRAGAELWELFRIGPPGSYDRRSPYRDGRFPADAFDQFVRQVVPVNRDGIALRQQAYDALLRQVGPCMLVTHSAAGPYGMRGDPGLLRAHVAIEPSGAPDCAQAGRLKDVPHLFVWGDHLDDESWSAQSGTCRRFHEALLDAGGRSEWIDLSERGVHGNSHLLMMDDNSDEIADLIADWLDLAGVPAVQDQGGAGGGEMV